MSLRVRIVRLNLNNIHSKADREIYRHPYSYIYNRSYKVTAGKHLDALYIPISDNRPVHIQSTMSSVGAVTRQIAALEISTGGSKQTSTTSSSSSSRSLHTKQPSQNVAKLLTKFAAPNPFSSKPLPPSSSLRHVAQNQATREPDPATQSSIDIGRYDGGLEIDEEKRGEVVFGEAAEELALDSSVSRCVAVFFYRFTFSSCLPFAGKVRPVSGT